MKDTFNDNSYSEAVKTAHLRFAIIAPVIQELFTEPTKTAYYKKAAKRPLKMPDSREVVFNYNTFEKWEAAYKKDGMDGLMPKVRSVLVMKIHNGISIFFMHIFSEYR